MYIFVAMQKKRIINQLYYYISILSIAIAVCGCVTDRVGDDPSELEAWEDGDYMTIRQATKGSDLGGFNIIIMGDGFTSEHMTKGGTYEQIMNMVAGFIVDVEPMKSYCDYVNIYSVMVVSDKAGVDATSEEEAEQTALGCYYGDGTLVVGDHTAVQAYAYKIDEIDYSKLMKSVICVVLNDDKHAGTTYFFQNVDMTIAYCPYDGFDNTLFSQVVHHEVVGHGVGRLLDEYVYYTTTIDSETLEELTKYLDLGIGVNLAIDREDVAWSYMFDISEYDDTVGIYEGGYFYSKGVYRSEFVSCMEDNRAYFNAPSRQAIVERIFRNVGDTFSLDDFLEGDIATMPSVIPEPVSATISRSEEEAEEHLHPPIIVESGLIPPADGE